METINESAQDRQRTLDLFSSGRDPEWRNRLTWGDKKYVLPSLLPELAGRLVRRLDCSRLIYPRSDVGAGMEIYALKESTTRPWSGSDLPSGE